MRKYFVTYYIALKLKELGFDEPCLGRFVGENTFILDSGDLSQKQNTTTYAPLSPIWEQVIDWFREKHNIHISIYPKMDVNCIDYTAKIYQYSEDSYFGEGDDEEYLPGGLKMIFEERLETYEDAREQVILKAIELCQKEK